MNIKSLSAKFEIRALNEADIPEIIVLCQGNPMYYQYCPPAVTAENIRSDMTILPPGTKPDKKFYIGYFQQGQLIAVMDLIDGYPDINTAFIGFFMMNCKFSGKGMGSDIIQDACDYFKASGYSMVRLGYAKGNPQCKSFWLKNHFVSNGIETQADDYIAVGMERNL